MTAAEDEPLAREPEARHRRRPAGMLAKKARQGSRCRCRCCGGSANISAAGIVDSIVSRGSASVSISLNPRPKPRKERSDGHALQRERGAHLPGKGSDREREREREREAAIDVLVHVPAFLVDFRSNPRSTDNPGQSCSSSRGR